MKIQPIINSHTHIFSYKDVPPFLARTFIPWPLYLLTYFPLIFWIFRGWNNTYSFRQKVLRSHRKTIARIKSNPILFLLYKIILVLLAANAIYYILDWTGFLPGNPEIDEIIEILITYKIIYPTIPLMLKIAIIFLGYISAKWLRSLITKIGKALVKPLSYLPNKKSLEFINRYLKIAKIANYKKQATAYNKLYKMYPPGSKFVVLTMDMTYMNLTPPRNFYKQLNEISLLMDGTNKNYKNMVPFIFVDPRRIIKDKNFFRWEWDNRQKKIKLKECKLKTYLEEGHFRGIKIYPALGYFPFDEELLPLWQYCVQEQIPITTHCTVGTIFYRKRMQRKWFEHPVFKDKNGKPIDIHARRNIVLQKNFTNPLNYLVLVEPHFLKVFLGQCRKEVQEIFGYISIDKDLDRDLSKLKINIAHYGGIEQWKKHLDSDRLEYAQEIMEMPNVGIRLCAQQSNKDKFLPEKPADVWEKADWYAIISSMMLQYDNVYADISYIIHTPEIAPLLNLTLENENLCKKVLFGTDYYVVRNHKSEKELYAEMLIGFSEEQLEQIGKNNPNDFLRTKSHHTNLL